MDLRQILKEIEKEHPYKVVGDLDSYSQYNEGWNDCITRIDAVLSGENYGWIPVEEALPEIEGCYLVTMQRSGDYERPKLDVMSNCFIKERGLWSGEVFSHDYVIAWQYLPQPYKPERNKDVTI